VTHVVNKTVIHHKTVVIKTIQVIRHPTTGRFAAPQVPRGAAPGQMAPPSDVTISIPRLSIVDAPVWTRGYQVDQAGGLTYDIVPFYGLTRFSYSVPFGTSGLTMVYGHDDIFGSIFRYLSNMKPGDRVTVAQGSHRYTYVVRSVSVVSPTDVSMITAPRVRPTLALISCTPYWVDTQRVAVIAQMQ
jgi:LPXTG-site transpeptidase (sortase) family protein